MSKYVKGEKPWNYGINTIKNRTTKFCWYCKTTRQREEFVKSKNSNDGLGSECVFCNKARQQKWRENNREKYLASNRRYAKKNRDKTRWYRIKRNFGLTKENYLSILRKQNNQCAGCLLTPEGRGRWNTYYVDHCHKTGKVRGLLCGKCNLVLGHANDNPDILKRLAKYLS